MSAPIATTQGAPGGPQGSWRKLFERLREGLEALSGKSRPAIGGRAQQRPGYWQGLMTLLPDRLGRALKVAEKHWLWLLAVGTLVVFVVLACWSSRLVSVNAAPDEACLKAALVSDSATAAKVCSVQVDRLVSAVTPGGRLTCSPEGQNTGLMCAFGEPGRPRLFVWADNVLVALYTGLFGGCIGRAYVRVRAQRRFAPIGLQLALGASVASCLVGAVLDLAENFWLLAHMGEELTKVSADRDAVAEVSVWKFRLAVSNLALASAWSAWAAWRRRVPYPVLFRWPRWCWDRRSRAWFDPRTVVFDVGSAAQVDPLLAADLPALCGAPAGAQVSCNVDGSRLAVRAESTMLQDPYVVVAELEADRRTVRTVVLACPNLDPTLRDQGLDERMVLACCCSAWRLGALTLESVVPASPDASVRGQNRRWVRLALRLGWDAEIPKAVRESPGRVPRGLAHVRTMQELTRYPDGRRWWSLENFELTLRFVCDPEAVQLVADPPPKQFDLERLSVDRLCLIRLQEFAARRGVRLGL